MESSGFIFQQRRGLKGKNAELWVWARIASLGFSWLCGRELKGKGVNMGI